MGNVHTQLIIPSTTQEWSWGRIMISYERQATAPKSLHNNIHCMALPIYDVGLLLFTEVERLGWMEDPFCTHDGRFMPHSVSLSVPWTRSLFQHLQFSELVSIKYNFPKWCLTKFWTKIAFDKHCCNMFCSWKTNFFDLVKYCIAENRKTCFIDTGWHLKERSHYQLSAARVWLQPVLRRFIFSTDRILLYLKG